MKKALKTVRIVILAATILASVVSLFLLPEQVAVQWRDGLASNWLNRYAAVLLPVFLSAVSLYCWKNSYERMEPLLKNQKTWRVVHTALWTASSCLGIALDVVFLMRNL